MKGVQRGVHLKKTFKLAVGRTLGPGATLAAANAAFVGERDKDDNDVTAREVNVGQTAENAAVEEVREEGDTRYGPEDEEDVLSSDLTSISLRSAELRSITAARLVSASIARVAPAATLVAAPLHPPKPMHAVVGKWMDHPFADSDGVVEDGRSDANGEVGDVPLHADVDGSEDFEMLERELEELRGRFVDSKPSGEESDAAKTESTLKATTNAIQTPTPGPTPGKAKARTLAKPRPKQSSRRRKTSVTKSSRPLDEGVGNLKSEWAPQSSSSSSSPSVSTSGSPSMPLKFPMFFPNPLVPAGSSIIFSAPAQSEPFLPEPGHPEIRLQPQSAPTTPRGHSAIRLSAMKIGSMRNAFAGVGALMSHSNARNNGTANSSANGTAPGIGEMITEDSDGDFMDLRDPFASPPPSTSKARRSISTSGSGGQNALSADPSREQPVDEELFGSGGINFGGSGSGRKMNAWGRLPMPARMTSIPSTPVLASTSRRAANASGARVVGRQRSHRRERRTRKTTLTGLGGLKNPIGLRTADDDMEIDLEEALLAQRLLRRLDSDGWEYRA